MIIGIKALFVVACISILFVLQVAALPPGFMTFFDRTECPQGWELFSSSQGRLIVSVTNAANSGITVGVPLTDQEDRTHSHRTTLSGDLKHQDVAAASGTNTQSAQHGTVSTKFISNEAPSGLPFTQLILCRISSSQSSMINYTSIGTIAFFDPSVDACPNQVNGTSWLPVGALNGRIAVGGYVESGGVSNNQPSYSSGEDRKHNHTNNQVLVPETKSDFIGIDGCCNQGPSQFESQLLVTGDSDAASSNLPYVQLLTCASQDYYFGINLPDGALIFNEQKCPPGWELALEVAGRLLVSLPAGGQPGAYFGGRSFSPNAIVDPVHSHAFNATINFPSVGIELASGGGGGPYPASGSFPVIGSSTTNDVDVPFTMYPLCRQSSDRTKRAGSGAAKGVLNFQYQNYKEREMIKDLKARGKK